MSAAKPCLHMARFGYCNRKHCDFAASHSWPNLDAEEQISLQVRTQLPER